VIGMTFRKYKEEEWYCSFDCGFNDKDSCIVIVHEENSHGVIHIMNAR